MSSNIRINRVCQHCGSDFVAKTTATLYCSKKCNSAAYKAKVRMEKIEASNLQTVKAKQAPIETLKTKEFLTVKDVAALLNCSRRSAYRMVSTGVIPSLQLSERKTIIRRSDIDNLFDQQINNSSKPEQQVVEVPEYQIKDCYTLKEIETTYGLADRVVYELIKRNKIPKIIKGRYTYVPKQLIDTILNPKNKVSK